MVLASSHSFGLEGNKLLLSTGCYECDMYCPDLRRQERAVLSLAGVLENTTGNDCLANPWIAKGENTKGEKNPC
jgi:hypothetical protein